MCSTLFLEFRFELGATRRRVKPTEFYHKTMQGCSQVREEKIFLVQKHSKIFANIRNVKTARLALHKCLWMSTVHSQCPLDVCCSFILHS